MKRSMTICASIAVFLVLTASSAMAGWTSFVVRNGATAPAINDVTVGGLPAKEFVISGSNMKAAWGTSQLDGQTLNNILALSIDRLDNPSRFTAGSGPAVAPYINIWITNGSGKYAVIANEPSNAEWAGAVKWDMTWADLKTKTVKVYETNDKSWLPNAGVGLKFDALKDFVIQAPTAAQLAAGWSGLGTGAPRELGTNSAFGINWVFGDTLSNYVSGDSGYVVANPTVVPEPATMSLLALGGLAAMFRRKHK